MINPLILTALAVLPSCLAAPKVHEQASSQIIVATPGNTTLRDIMETDIADVTTIVVDAFAPSAAWNYVMPELQKHKHEIWTCLYQEVSRQWQNHNRTDIIGKVITVPAPDAAGRIRDRAVALAIWKIWNRNDTSTISAPADDSLSIQSLTSYLSLNCTPIPGTNVTRAVDAERQTERYMKKYFYEAYEKQLYLNLLATHPDWDGNGFGARHCHWGMNLAKELDVPLTLFATPVGWPLYDSLGFESVKNATIHLFDGLGTIWSEVMRWTH